MKLDQKFVRFVIVQMVLVASISILLSSGMKVIFEQDRPCVGLEDCPDNFSFPSRHTAAALMLNNKVDVLVASRSLGHANPGITLNVYGHLLPGSTEEAAKVMESLVLDDNYTRTAHEN